MEIQPDTLDFFYFPLIGFRAVAPDADYDVYAVAEKIGEMRGVRQVDYRRTACCCQTLHEGLGCQRNAWDVSLKHGRSRVSNLEKIVWQIWDILPMTTMLFRDREGNVTQMRLWLTDVAAIGGF